MEVYSPGQEMPSLKWNKNPQLVLSVRQLNPVHSLTPCLSSILVFVFWTSTMRFIQVIQLRFCMYLWPSLCMLHVLPIHLDLISIIVLSVQITNILHFPVVSSLPDSTSHLNPIVRHLQSLFHLVCKARLHIHENHPEEHIASIPSV